MLREINVLKETYFYFPNFILTKFILYFSFVRVYWGHHVRFRHVITTVQPELVVCVRDNWPYCGHCRRNLHLYRRTTVGGNSEKTAEKRTVSADQILASRPATGSSDTQ